MKSFALHLVVVFIVGAQYHQIETFCSSTAPPQPLPSSSSSSSSFSSSSSSSSLSSSLLAAQHMPLSSPLHQTHDRGRLNLNIVNAITVPPSAQTTNNNIQQFQQKRSSTLLQPHHHDNYHHQKQQQQQQQQHPYQQTTKTPRTIQRRVAGHLQHLQERKIYTESTTASSSQLTRNYVRGRSSSPLPSSSLSSSSSSPSPLTIADNYLSNKNNTTILKKYEPNADDFEDWNSDAALLDDPQDDGGDNWDNGILRSSAGAGKEAQTKGKKKDDSKQKTLADQVKEGKYGLIEKELFQSQPKRPGVISYLGNKEVPSDNANNYGGLNDDDIWLAEDHLLILKGGNLNDGNKDEPWEPIDDYEAPNRQIKIPANPKVPPPFPVQLEDNGPIQFIGNNKFPFINSISNKSLSLLPGNGYLPAKAFGDNEKNLLTGTGSFKNVTNDKGNGGGGGYFYPIPNPTWLINNETVINPFLNFIQPQSGAVGPNGSFDNNTDYIDEDDPSLYYPPPYSFVYKSNYSNPVPPGPLVPGIVLPPPPNAFARLEEPIRKTTPVNKEIPFKDVLTKITEYTPKTIIITTTTTTTSTTTTETPPITSTITPPPKEIYYTITRPPKPERTRLYTTQKYIATNTPSTVPQSQIPTQQDVINIIPKVSLPTTPASPAPQYINYVPKVSTLPPQSTTLPPPSPPTTTTQIFSFAPKVTYKRPESTDLNINLIPKVSSPAPQSPDIINFVPKAPTDAELFSGGNPIYYEYFDARRVPPQQNENYYNDYPTTNPPTKLPPAPISSNRPHKKVKITTPAVPIQQTRLSKNYIPQRNPYKYDEYLYITPRPEIRPNGISDNFVPSVIIKPSPYKPVQNFEREINAIRQTLQLYKDQQIQQNYIPRAPKSKPVYEYSFDATRSNRDFLPPLQYDEEPFQPMVKYSRPIDDTDGFRAIAYDKSDGGSSGTRSLPSSNYYVTTSTQATLVEPHQQSRTRVGAKSYSKANPYSTTPKPIEYPTNDQRAYIQSAVRDDQQQYTASRTTQTNPQPWVSIEKQIVQEVEPQITRRPSHRHRTSSNGYSRNNDPSRSQLSGGYYYNPPSSPPISNIRQNDRYYQLTDEKPVPQHLGVIKSDVNQYRPQHQHQQQQQQQQQFQSQQQQQQLPISLENDTYVNYAPNRPPINPDAEFIRSPYPGQQQQLPKSQSQRIPPPSNRGQQQQGRPVSLHRDILVNYRHPLPPINPDSEFIQPQVVNRNAPIYQRPVVPHSQYRIPGDQPDSGYYYTPREIRYRKN